MFGISPVSCQKHSKNGNKQKITVVEIVSTTVTDLAKVHEVDTILQESVMQQQPLMNTQLQKLMFFQSFCT